MQTAIRRRELCLGLLVAGAAPRLAAQTRLALDGVNRMDEDAFVKTFGDVYELSPRFARAAFTKLPFATVTALHQAFVAAFAAAPREQQIKFLHDIFDLGDKQAKPAAVTDASRREMGASGINTLGAADQALLDALNKAYRAKFDIAFWICSRRNTVPTIFAEYMRRLNNNSLETELALAVRELSFITRLRIAETVTGPGMPQVYGDVTAHVLDATIGKPAGGVAVEIHEVWGEKSRKVGSATTSVDGRATVMEGLPVPIGRYELRFAIGDYFRKRGAIPAAEAPFLDVVPMRTYVGKAEDSYHFPLIASPFGYTVHG
jgi:2-oxo-4-hydroxy-4-carboxy-5-ureidoimidazoline decarboxylase